MVIHDLHVIGIAFQPLETNAPLVVDPDAVLPLTISTKPLEMIGGRRSQIINRHCPVQHAQFAQSAPLNTLRQTP